VSCDNALNAFFPQNGRNILVIIGTSLDSVATTGQIFWVCVHWLLFAFVLQCVYISGAKQHRE